MPRRLFSRPALPRQSLAQGGLDNDQAIDTIVGTEVGEEQSRAAADAGKVIAAIEKTQDSISKIRKTSTLDKVDIVFLEDAAATEGGPPPEIEAKVKEHEAEIAELRKELEGNAMLFHAIDSREVLVRDVLAIEFDDARQGSSSTPRPASPTDRASAAAGSASLRMGSVTAFP